MGRKQHVQTAFTYHMCFPCCDLSLPHPTSPLPPKPARQSVPHKHRETQTDTHLLPHGLPVLVALRLGDAHLVHPRVEDLDFLVALLPVLRLLVQVLILGLEVRPSQGRPVHLALRWRLHRTGREVGMWSGL